MEELWMMDRPFLEKYLNTVYGATEIEIKAAIEKAGSSLDETMKGKDIYSVKGSVAEIRISGPMTKNPPSFWAVLFGYGGTQYAKITEAIEKAEKNPSVKSIDLLMDTPGGTVAGCDPTNRAIAGCSKPIRAINCGMIASAGYYCAVAANEIKAQDVNAQTGSIGVMVSTVSYKDMDKKYGIKEITIRSSNAPKKNPEIDSKEGQDEIQKRIDAMENNFIARVAEGRGVTTDKVKSDFGQGSMLIAYNPDGPDAIDAGMIDGMIDDQAEEAADNGNLYASEKTGNTPVKNKNTAPLAGGKEILTVNELEKLLAENPGAKALYDQAIINAKAEGKAETEKAHASAVAKVAPIMESENYDAAMKKQAVKALAGEMTIDTFMAVVSMEDMRLERANNDAAAEETEATEETPATNAHVEKPAEAQAAEDLKAKAEKLAAARFM